MTRQQGKDELFNKWGHNSPLGKKKKNMYVHIIQQKQCQVVQRLNVEREIIK